MHSLFSRDPICGIRSNLHVRALNVLRYPYLKSHPSKSKTMGRRTALFRTMCWRLDWPGAIKCIGVFTLADSRLNLSNIIFHHLATFYWIVIYLASPSNMYIWTSNKIQLQIKLSWMTIMRSVQILLFL